jgi:amidase
MTTTEQVDLAFAGPVAQAKLIRDGELKSRELVELYLSRIESMDDKFNAFRVVLAEEALAAADALEGTDLSNAGPLVGIPVAIKDDHALAGQSVTYGSKSPAPVQQADCAAVAALRSAGAIPIGVTNVPELMAWPWTATEANGVTRNPWDTTRTPGGSSGGSAAAVAAGLASVGTATDGGGSIRIPAACCGLVGMKPTRGLVPTAPLAEMHLGLTVIGAVARTVADSALMLDAFTGTSVYSAAAAHAPEEKLRVAISTKVPPGFLTRLSADQRLAFDRTARLLEELGHQVSKSSPNYGLMSLQFTPTFFRGTAELFDTLEDPSATSKQTQKLAAIAHRLVSEKRRDSILAKRPATTERIMKLWDEFDVLLMPVLASTAIAADQPTGRHPLLALDRAARFMPWNPVANLTGQPSIAIPAGIGRDGLPLSVQLVGRLGAEELLYSLAGQIEAAGGNWAPIRPPV